jgi:hypothetical protein
LNRVRIRNLACTLGVAVLAASCSGGGLDMEAVKKRIASVCSQRFGAAPSAVSCPAEIEKKAGLVTVCIATMGKLAVQVEVAQSDANGTFQVFPRVFDPKVLLTRLTPTLTASFGGPPSDLDCGRVVPVTPGAQFRCTVKDPSGKVHRFPLMITDAQGGVALGAFEDAKTSSAAAGAKSSTAAEH